MKTLFVVIISCSLLMGLYSCSKDGLSKSPPPPPIQNEEGLVSAARTFFETNVISAPAVFSDPWGMGKTSRQAIHKTPLWEDAYIATKKDFNVVVVPLKFDKQYISKQDDNPRHNVSLEKQTKLYIYNDGKDDKAVVVTFYPSGDYIDGKTSKFSGYILVEDWAGNSIREIGADNGKYFKVSKGENRKRHSSGLQSANKLFTSYCYYEDHYLCSVDGGGNPYDCLYLYSEWLGCFLEPLHDEFGPAEEPGGGGTYYLEDYQLAKSKTWLIAQEPVNHIGEIYGTTQLKGKREPSEPQGGHFTGISHQYSSCNFCGQNETWVETFVTTTITTPQSARITIKGKLTYYLGTFNLTGNATWGFSDVF